MKMSFFNYIFKFKLRLIHGSDRVCFSLSLEIHTEFVRSREKCKKKKNRDITRCPHPVQRKDVRVFFCAPTCLLVSIMNEVELPNGTRVRQSLISCLQYFMRITFQKPCSHNIIELFFLFFLSLSLLLFFSRIE